MGKPLLTDEILERAKRGEPLYDEEEGDYASSAEGFLEEYAQQWEDDYTGYQEGETIRIPVKPSVVKSRRIETVKREEFRSKVNKILFWVILLVILFILAVLFI